MTGKDLVIDFLRTMEARDLAKAKAMLAPGMKMTFPGDKVMDSLEDLVAWSKARYKFARKTFDKFDEAVIDGKTVVYSMGTLSGEWLDGTPFSNVRYVDRFEIVSGKIVDQQVWNDLAEFRT